MSLPVLHRTLQMNNNLVSISGMHSNSSLTHLMIQESNIHHHEIEKIEGLLYNGKAMKISYQSKTHWAFSQGISSHNQTRISIWGKISIIAMERSDQHESIYWIPILVREASQTWDRLWSVAR
jgi:hypothetical protein